MSFKYLILNQDGDVIAEEHSAKDAVEASFRYDGFGFEWVRDADGVMGAMASRVHIGNNRVDLQDGQNDNRQPLAADCLQTVYSEGM